MRSQVVREPAVAGAFYPGSAGALGRSVREYLSEAPVPEVEGRIVGLVAPHAGYQYSGAVAAAGYAALRDRGFRRAVVLAPSHRMGFRGAALTDAGAYRTPLGLVPVDAAACERLRGRPLYMDLPRAHEGEHSLEVQLPFLQEVLGEFTLVPVVLGQIEGADRKVVAGPLADLLDGETVIVASSDFTHYGAGFGYVPFTDDVRERIHALDRGAIERIERLDAAGFAAYRERTGATICGECPIGVLMEAVPRGAAGRLLAYDTSGDMTGDFSHSVSYAAVIFTVPEGE
ncbi:MAG: AmmeMemoRadiSam system protein B [bacterium]|nr:AmmeMemoRadiSam system protein B [bacterium]